MSIYCCVPNCYNNNRDNKDLSFYNFPNNPERWTLWLEAIGRIDLDEKFKNNKRSSYRICSAHFDAKSLIVKKKLVENAVPSIIMPSDLPNATNSGQKILFQVDLANCPLTDTSMQAPSLNRKRRLSEYTNQLQKKIRGLEAELIKSKNTTKEQFLELCDKFFEDKVGNFVKCQILLQQKFKGNRYPFDFKMFALNLFYSHPQAYRFLQTFFCLPSIRTLQRLNIPISTGLNTHFLEALKLKASNMPPKEKLCVVCVVSMSLKTNLYYDISSDKLHGLHEINGHASPIPANYALIIMVRGIFEKWKQPVAYALTSECKNYPELSKWIDEVILTLIDLGLDVRGFVSNLGSDFWNAAESRNVSEEQNYFQVNNKKIYYIFDVPHLLKCVRNNLMNYEFRFENGKIAKWEHIVQVHNEEKNETLKLCPKITEQHVRPNSFQKKKLKYACQIFSNTLAAAMKVYIRLGKIEESAKSTVELIQLFNNLFDLLNSSVKKNEYVYKRAYTGDQFQEDFLNKAVHFFKTVRLVKRNTETENDVTDRAFFIREFLVTIQSIRDLLHDVKAESHNFLMTRNLNLECLENFFGEIRLQGGSCREPTCVQLSRAFRKFFFTNMLNNSQSKDRDDDLSNILFQVEHYVKAKQSFTVTDNSMQLNTLTVNTSDYVFQLPERNILIYITGCLINKCLEFHSHCENFLNYLLHNSRAENITRENISMLFNSYSNKDTMMNPTLILPPDNLIKFVEYMETQFRLYFTKDHVLGNIGTEILSSIESKLVLPCDCFPLNYIKKLFLRIRIHHTLKYNNANFNISRKNNKYINVCHFT